MTSTVDAMLAGVRIVDTTRLLPGPYAGWLLAEMGAEVIKVEQPGTGDPSRLYGPEKDGVPLAWAFHARNKKSVTLDLRTERGAQLLRSLVARSDVLIQSFRPETVARYGLTYEELERINQRLVVVYVTGFGLTGPYRDRPGFGTLAEAMSGYAEMTGEPDGPPTLPQFALADSVAALYGAFGVMNALYWRDAGGGGVGQYLDLSLLEPLFSILGPLATMYDQLGTVPRRTGSRIFANAPRNVYQTRDGHWIAIAASAQRIAEQCFVAIGRPELISDPRFRTARDRVAHVDEVDEIVGDWVAAHDREEALRVLVEHGVSVAPVMGIADLVADPQMLAREAITSIDDPTLGAVRMQGVVPALSRTPGRIAHPGPRLGEHNEEIYGQLLGLSSAELAQLREDHVI